MKNFNTVLKERGVEQQHIFTDWDGRMWKVYIDDPVPGIPSAVTIEYKSIVIDVKKDGVNISGQVSDLLFDCDLQRIIRWFDGLRAEMDDQCI